MSQNFYSLSAETLDGKNFSFENLKGKLVLIVNVASRCGFTPQYTGLETLYKRYRASGFEILGFPCNQFGDQEPGSPEDIQQFCSLNYPVSFPIFKKVDVNGPNAHPVYEYLKSQKSGFLGLSSIKWNFTKFLVNQNGQVLERFAPTTTPEKMESKIASRLSRDTQSRSL